MLFPEPWGKVYVISITKARRKKFLDRCKRYRVNLDSLLCCQGVHGASLDRTKFKQQRWLADGCKLTRGQIGCYDSHRALWTKMVSESIPYMLIAEDDCAIVNTSRARQHLQAIWTYLQHKQFDALFLSRSKLKRENKEQVCKGLARPGAFWGLNLYLLTLSGARKLLQDERNQRYSIPVDVVVSRMARNDQLNAYCAAPCVFDVVKEVSYTNNIV